MLVRTNLRQRELHVMSCYYSWGSCMLRLHFASFWYPKRIAETAADDDDDGSFSLLLRCFVAIAADNKWRPLVMLDLAGWAWLMMVVDRISGRDGRDQKLLVTPASLPRLSAQSTVPNFDIALGVARQEPRCMVEKD